MMMKTAEETAWRLSPANVLKADALAKTVGRLKYIKIWKTKVFRFNLIALYRIFTYDMHSINAIFICF